MTEYVLQGRYLGPHGWEDLCAEDTRAEAEQRRREYVENEGRYIPVSYRIIRRKEST